MLKEFKEFIARGNVIDLAVALVIGAAFGRIITSFVEDIIMPPIGMLLGKVDFSNLFVSLTGQHYNSLAEAKAAGAPTLNYGQFLNTIISFLIVAFVIFLVIRQVNRMKRQAPEVAPVTKACPYCQSSIAVNAVRCAHCTSDLKPAAG